MWNWNEQPKGKWDLRINHLKDPDAIFPPVECLVVNAQNERIPFVFFVDFDTGRVGKYVSRINEWGVEVVKVNVTIDDNGEEKKRMEEEWISSPGVKIVPFPAGYKEEIARINSEKKRKYIATRDGTIIENT